MRGMARTNSPHVVGIPLGIAAVALVAVGGARGLSHRGWGIGAALVGLGLVVLFVAWRIWTVSVGVEGREVMVRNILRTRRWGVAEAEGFELRGAWVRLGLCDGRRVRIEAISETVIIVRDSPEHRHALVHQLNADLERARDVA
jgi:hypothetical protein